MLILIARCLWVWSRLLLLSLAPRAMWHNFLLSPLIIIFIRPHLPYTNTYPILCSSFHPLSTLYCTPSLFHLCSRSKRQFANGTDFGTTVRLNGTNRHYFALVHWTGHPSEVLFIVTMTRRSNPTDSCLWRWASSSISSSSSSFSSLWLILFTPLCSRSTDYGVTFTNDSYKFNDSSAVISWYYVSPFDQYVSIIHSSVVICLLM